MSNARKFLATIDRYERMKSSRNGNPRFRVFFASAPGVIFSMRTAPDAGFAYGHGNENFRDGATVVVTYDGRNNIVNMTSAAHGPRLPILFIGDCVGGYIGPFVTAGTGMRAPYGATVGQAAHAADLAR